MTQATPFQNIRSVVRVLDAKQAEMATALLEANQLIQQPPTIGCRATQACIFAARSIHIIPIESCELAACPPFQVAIHTRQGVGVLVWHDFEAVSNRGQVDPLLSGTARFIALEQCCPEIQYIAGAELPFLFVAVEQWLTAAIARQS